MPFVPRSQIEQQQANAAPPPMPVVENYPKQPTASSPSCPQQTSNTEEQINELNELLVHVLDEISSMKDALYENARKKNKRHKQQHKERVPSDDEDTSEDDQEERRRNHLFGSHENAPRTHALARAALHRPFVLDTSPLHFSCS